MSTESPAQQFPTWINADTQLPEKRDADPNGKVLAFFDGGYQQVWNWEDVVGSPTHWMRLPPPPKALIDTRHNCVVNRLPPERDASDPPMIEEFKS